MNKYRVDSVEDTRVPCGTATIVHLGSCKNTARREFIRRAISDLPAILSEWDAEARDYKILANTKDKLNDVPY